jgi:arylsulfatase A-like enzyme
LGSHGLQGKTLPYEEASRLPLIIVDPRGNCKGKVCSSVVANIDYAPTILDFAGIPVPRRMDGRSLVPLLENPSQKIHDNIMLIQNWGISQSETNKCLAVVKDDYKYIFWPYADKNLEPAEELYNLAADPIEAQNVLKTDSPMPEILARMRKIYDSNLAFWTANAVSEPYKRHKVLFSRSVPWQDKKFKLPRQFVSRELYEEVTGKTAPPGFIDNDKMKKGRRKIRTDKNK